MNAIKKEAPYYTVNGSIYQPGAVFQHIVSMRYDMIIGLDFGHGESVVFKNIKNSRGEWSYEALKCGPNKETEVPSYLSYGENHQILIGRDAPSDPDFFQYFKVIPDQWSMPADDAGHTFQDVIRDFIAELWHNVLIWDAGEKTVKEALQDDRLLLAVGCPSSDKWTSAVNEKKYIELIAEATGCKSEHIVILPESTAAIMVPIISGKGENNSCRVDSGVAVYDFGSSTVDFTYVYMGKRLIVRSLYLGGADIDKAMLRRVLKENGVAPASLSPQDTGNMYAKLRELKEKFYRTGRSSGKQTSWTSDNRPLNFVIDAEFMRTVLREDRAVQTRDADYIGLSWHDCLEKFIRNTAAHIASAPCGTVILTGGTSRVTDVSEICTAIYGSDRLIQEENPAISVAKGLCYAKGLETRSEPLIDDTKLILKPRYDEAFEATLSAFAQRAFGVSWEASRVAVDSFLERGENRYLMKDFLETAEALLKTPEKQAELRTIFLEEFTSSLFRCQAEIRTEVNKLSEAIYRTELKTPPQLPDVLMGSSLDEILGNLNLKEVLKPDMLTMDGLSDVMTFVALVIVAANPELWLVAIVVLASGYGIEGLVHLIVKKMPYITAKQLRKMQRRLNDPEAKDADTEKKASKIVESLKKELDSSHGDGEPQRPTPRELFDTILNNQLEIAVGQILFLLYEEKPE